MNALAPFLVLGLLPVLLMVLVALRRRPALAQGITLLGLGIAFALLFVADVQVPQRVTPLLVIDGYALYFSGLVLLAALAVVALSGRYLQDRGPRVEEYFILLTLATLGATVLTASRHFIALFLGIELLSVALYGLVAFVRERPTAVEAGVKYLILAAFSSAFLLFGLALIYARTGALELGELAGLLGGASPGPAGRDLLVLAGVGLMIVGFGFKLAVVPFHLWTPDVYQGAPAPVTAFVATASKGAVMAVLLRFAAMMDLSSGSGLRAMLALVAGASMLAGNLLALRQESLKRLLAYSSIAHLGYVLVAFLAGGDDAARAVAFYLAAYTVTTLGAFGVIAILSSANGSGTGDVDDLAGYRGLGRRQPFLAGVLALMLFSLAGIPLTAGFVGKFLVLAAGAGADLWALVVILAAGSAIGIYYYLRVVVALYLQTAVGETSAGSGAPGPRITLAGGITLALLSVLLLLLGVAPDVMLRMIGSSCAGVF